MSLAPTLLHLLGVRAPRCFAGTSLLSSEPSVVAHPSGAAFGEEVQFFPEGGGRCLSTGDRSEVALSRCEALTREASEELTAARLFVHHDLFDELGCEPERALDGTAASLRSGK